MKTAAFSKNDVSGKQSANSSSKSRKPFFSTSQGEAVQARMQLGRPGDVYEVQADHVADRVVNDKPASMGIGLAATVTPITQRQEEDESVQTQVEEEEESIQAQSEEEEEELQAQSEEEEEEELQAQSEEEEEELQAQSEEEEEEHVQARSSANHKLRVSEEVSRQVRAAKGLGNPLPATVRSKMEAQFGADFSGVRIHTDSLAVQLSKALRAQAFTRGNDIFFNQGKFSPGSRSGTHLLAHELTHTVQQGAVEADSSRTLRLSPEANNDDYELRPELLEAMRLARGEIGKVNAKVHGGDGKRIGWEQLRAYFNTALGGPVIHESIIDKITMISVEGKEGKKDALPSWCGIFTWWAMKKAGLPVPDWKLGGPVLDSLQVRPQGEMPRKGDIAIDVHPYNHFAMVTGLESSQDAEGKPKKLTRIA
ncbi:MAG: DUF4157 domain-containing protein, partial [Xanthomonadales bacterium]|nr:DUF4157 domain-containing protein [Xanthomonadales bacterium]